MEREGVDLTFGILLAVLASSGYGLTLNLDPGFFVHVLVLIGAGS